MPCLLKKRLLRSLSVLSGENHKRLAVGGQQCDIKMGKIHKTYVHVTRICLRITARGIENGIVDVFLHEPEIITIFFENYQVNTLAMRLDGHENENQEKGGIKSNFQHERPGYTTTQAQ